MKKTVYAIMIIAAAVLCGCKKVTGEGGIGTLRLEATAGGDYITKSTNSDIREFVVMITRPADGWTREYPRYADMPQNIELSSGSYTVTASSLFKADAAWDQPVYSGTAEFTINAGEMTPVALVCTLANMKVTIAPTENFLKEVTNFNVVVTNAGDWTDAQDEVNALTWDNEKIERGDAGYFSVAPLLVKIYGYRAIDGTEASAVKTISTVAARDHHIITIDARVTGEAAFELTIDDSVNEKIEDVYVDGFEEVPVDGGEQGGDDPGSGDDPVIPDPPVVDPTLPTVTWEANPDFAPVTMQSSGMNVELEIEVPNKIATFGVDVESDVLSETLAQLSSTPDYTYSAGHPFWMDMIYDDTLCENLGAMGLGIPLKNDLLGQTHVTFSLSGLIPLALMYQPTPGSYHYFNLKLTDEKGNALEKMITFVAPTE